MTDPPPDGATFTVLVGTQQFAIRVSDQTTYDKMLDRMNTGRVGVILGRVAKGDGGFNAPWSWHLVPSTIQVVDVSIEACDGRPSDVEANRDQWIATLQNYCPWGAKVVSVSSVPRDY